MTTAEALREAGARLAGAGCDSPALDAELLLAESLGTDRLALTLARDATLPAPEADRFEALVRRRERREPVAYIVGRKPFRHIELVVDRRVLVPRPETELLVEVALDLPVGARVVDVGTGSGAVALALKQERPDLRLTGVDVDERSLEVARANAVGLGLSIDLRRADLLDGAGGPFDAVLANLPYVADHEWPSVPPEVADHEPRRALAGGPDGLRLVSRLARQLDGIPFVAVEVGFGQAYGACCLLRDAGYRRVEPFHDLAGIERVIVARAG